MTCVYVYRYIYIYIYICTCVCMYVCMYVCMRSGLGMRFCLSSYSVIGMSVALAYMQGDRCRLPEVLGSNPTLDQKNCQM